MANYLTLLNLHSAPAQPERKNYGISEYCPPSPENPQHEYWQGLADLFLNWHGGKVSKREALAHELVFRCLALKALVVQDILPMIQNLGTDNEWADDPRHPALVALRNPNPSNTFADILSFLLLSEDVHGQSYLEILRSPTRAVVGIRPLQHDTVLEQPKPGAAVFGNGQWAAYRIEDIDHYQVIESTMRELDSRDVINLRAFDVRSPLAGRSAVSVALESVGLGQSLSKYARAYLEAGGPSGIIKLKNRQLTNEQAEAVQEKWWRRYNLLRGKQTGRVAVFDEDGDYQPIGSHLKDLDNESLRMSEQASICTALGVPGQLAQAYYAIRWGNQRAGQDAALKQFWDVTISPTLSRYRQIFDKYFLAEFEPRRAGIEVRCFWDTSNVKGLQEDADKKEARARAMYTAKISSLNEARTRLGLKPVPGGDEIPALVAEEAARQSLEQQKQGTDDSGKEKPSNDDAGKSHDHPETKTYDWNGLKLSRKPTDAEMKVLQAVANAQDSGKATMLPVLTAARSELLGTGKERLAAMGDNYATLTLALSADAVAAVNTAVSQAYLAGQQSVSGAKGWHAPEQKALGDIIRRIAGFAITALINQVQSRLISELARRLMRGVEKAEALEQLEAYFEAESLSYVEDLVTGAGYEAVAEGRMQELTAQAKPGDYWLYSAILDANTCDVCKADDLKRADSPEKLPHCPNSSCRGTWRCRCMLILVQD